MAEMAPGDNAPLEMRPWTRWITRKVSEVLDSVAGLDRRQGNANRELNSALNATVSQVKYLASLYTHNGWALSFNTGPVSGDGDFTYFEFPDTTLTVNSSTGGILIGVGAGECSLDPGGVSAIAEVTYSIKFADTGEVYFEKGYDVGRLYLLAGQRLGLPLYFQTSIGVPVDRDMIVTAAYGIWSPSLPASPASAQFNTPYLTVQVISN